MGYNNNAEFNGIFRKVRSKPSCNLELGILVWCHKYGWGRLMKIEGLDKNHVTVQCTFHTSRSIKYISFIVPEKWVNFSFLYRILRLIIHPFLPSYQFRLVYGLWYPQSNSIVNRSLLTIFLSANLITSLRLFVLQWPRCIILNIRYLTPIHLITWADITQDRRPCMKTRRCVTYMTVVKSYYNPQESLHGMYSIWRFSFQNRIPKTRTVTGFHSTKFSPTTTKTGCKLFFASFEPVSGQGLALVSSI